METMIPGMSKREVITFDSAETLERFVHMRVMAEVDRRVKEKITNGWITGQEAIEKGYFPFKLRTLKTYIREGKIEGTIKGDKEVYVSIPSLQKYIKGE